MYYIVKIDSLLIIYVGLKSIVKLGLPDKDLIVNCLN